MVFNRKGFFLTFDEAADKKPATVAPVAPVAPAPAEEAPVKVAIQLTQAKPVIEEGAGKPVLTTAEALAAELREEEVNRPAPSLTTFAPANLTPGGALPVRRRRGGANLAPFRAIGASLFSK
ncbi:MAG: hypothetical protein WCK64_04050 [Synechococcaceae cyanobacterium ELA445]|jgi:hypothetical protein